GAGAQSVTQPEDHVSVFARAPVQVKCNYSYPGSPVLFWYVQYPKQASRGTSGDSVTQTEVPVTLPEEASVFLNCIYQTAGSNPYLFWYVQYVNKAPQLLLKGSTANPRPEHQGFHATLVKSNRTFHLQKPSVQTSDSAVYYCALSDTVRGAAGGAEHKPRGAGGVWLWVGLGGRGTFSHG
ncbi:T-cell receptor alpha chain V region CTL-F3, partial [Camelus dromedarius]